jgi:type I restriction enzyme S subunit
MKTAALKEVAPAQAARLSLQSKDLVWQLNLDQIEAQSGRILSKVTGFASAAGSSTQSFDTGNVLYSKLRPYLNKVVCPDSPGIATTELVPLRPDPKKLDRQYLTYYLRSPEFVTSISNEVAGAKMPRVTMKVFWDHEIPLPPLAEQKRIAAILDAADALRAKRREALAQLDALIQSSFLTLFGDPVSNPMGWKAVPLRSVADLENGDRSSNYPSGPDVLDSGVLFLSTKNISDNQLVFNNCQFISESKFKSLSRGKLRRNDLVITLRGTLGSCAIFDCEFETGFINAQILILHPSDKIASTYLHALIITERMKRHFEELSTGVAVKQLTGKQIGDLLIPLPPLPLQQKFAAIVESIERQKTTQRAHLAELDALFAVLQHRAFRGEL